MVNGHGPWPLVHLNAEYTLDSVDLKCNGPLRFQYSSQFSNQLSVVDSAEPVWVLFELRNRFMKLCHRPIKVPFIEVVQPDGCLDQTLIEEPQGTLGLPPQVLPGLVSLEVLADVEKIYSVLKQIGHRNLTVSY
jgi:hypothetical protein